MISQKRYSFTKTISVFFLVLVLISLNVNQSLGANLFQQETVEQAIQSAQTAIDNNKYKDAKKKLQQALKIKPDSAHAHLLMALVYRQDNNRKEAIKHVYQALNIQMDNGDAHYLMAVLLYETNETGQAGTELDKAIQLGIKAFNVYALKGRLALADRNYKVALENFEKALQLNSTNKEQVEAIRSQTEALKSYVAFSERKDKGSFKRPMPVNRPRPNYSEDARRNGVQGIVKLYALIDETGKVQSTFLFNRLGYGLDEQAILAVTKMKFQPATNNGAAVAYWVPLEVEFKLK
jgi:TonB family protein